MEGTALEGSSIHCPNERLWLEVATGLTEPSEASRLLEHAAICQKCGASLKRCLKLVEDEMVTEEADLIHSLATSQPAWQRRMADTVTSRHTATRRTRLWPGRAWIPWGAAAAAVVVVVAVVGRQERWFRHGPPFDLLADACAIERPVDLRFPGAEYGPLHINRGPDKQSLLTNSPAFLEGQLEITRGLQKYPGDPAWLQAQARAHLMLAEYQEARKALERALDRAPGSTALQQDLAMAWFEAAEANGDNTDDYERSIELFSAVLRAKPDDLVALFNRAQAYEKVPMPDQAAEDWQHYVRLDSKSKWAEEARQHLKKLKEKIQALTDSSGSFELEPGDPAVMELVRAAYGRHTDPQLSSRARSKLAGLALQFASKYQDQWLADLMRDSNKLKRGDAVELLYEAFQQNKSGDPGLGAKAARMAISRFGELGVETGELRARFELAYGLQLSQRGRDCAREADQLRSRIARKPYAWLQAQADLEGSTGSAMAGDFDAGLQKATRAVACCRKCRLTSLQLRGVGFQASILKEIGRWREACALERAGLVQFWSGHYPPYRAYQFYDDLSVIAERLERLELARALVREAIAVLGRPADPATEPMERYKLARLALAVGDAGEAREEFAKSNQLFAALPHSPAMDLFRAYGDVGLAQSEVRRGNSRQSINELRRIEPVIVGIGNEDLKAYYYSILAEAQQLAHDFSASEQSLSRLLTFSERALRVLDSSREGLAWSQEMRDGYHRMVQLALQRSDPTRALALWEWYRAAELRIHRSPPDQPAPREPVGRFADLVGDVVESLRVAPGSSIITYLQSDDGLSVWNISASGISQSWLPVPRRQLTRLARHFAEAAADANSTGEDISMAGRELYARLVAPFDAAWGKGKTVFVETDGATALIPFEAIPTPEGGYLGERCAIVYSPGVLYAEARRRDGQADAAGMPSRVLAVGISRTPPELAGQFPPLYDALEEVQAVAALAPRSIELMNDAATPAAIVRALPFATIFHFAGHAIATPERSGLLLAASEGSDGGLRGFWSANDLPPGGLRRCALVVLSACSTGELEFSPLNDPDNLVRKFLSAGAGAVIASRWPVDSAATRELMLRFYAELKQGSPPAIALQKASQMLRHQNGMDYPRFWAAFSVFAASDNTIELFSTPGHSRS